MLSRISVFKQRLLALPRVRLARRSWSNQNNSGNNNNNNRPTTPHSLAHDLLFSQHRPLAAPQPHNLGSWPLPSLSAGPATKASHPELILSAMDETHLDGTDPLESHGLSSSLDAMEEGVVDEGLYDQLTEEWDQHESSLDMEGTEETSEDMLMTPSHLNEDDDGEEGEDLLETAAPSSSSTGATLVVDIRAMGTHPQDPLPMDAKSFAFFRHVLPDQRTAFPLFHREIPLPAPTASDMEDPCTTVQNTSTLQLDSVRRKRMKKMKKHKHRKRLKETRAKRRRATERKKNEKRRAEEERERQEQGQGQGS